jgi:hypothetical protein
MPPDKIGAGILGIDIGRVIIGPAGDDGYADTSFLSGTPEHAMQTPLTPDDGKVWLISKCDPGSSRAPS